MLIVTKHFLYVMTMNDIGKRAHVLKHSQKKYVVGAYDNILHEGSIWTGHRNVLSFILHKSIFLHFVHHGTKFYERYINSDDIKNVLLMMGLVSNQIRALEIFIIQHIRKYIC